VTRRYNEEEVRLILKQALDPALDESKPQAIQDGLTLQELQEIGAEVGIDPGRIQLAAARMESPVQAPANPYLGMPTTVRFESTIEGASLSTETESDVVSLIRTVLGRQGVVDRWERSFEWKARDPMGGRYVSITRVDVGLRLSVLGNYRDGVFSILGGVGGPVFVGAAAILSTLALGPAGILLGGAAVAALPPRFAYRAWRKREDATLASLHARLLDLLAPQTPVLPPEAGNSDKRS
jgi:hypothetical protein